MANTLEQQKQLENLLLSEDLEELKRYISKFLLCDELYDLIAKLNQFNVFNVLKLENAEIRHSNFLGWLLDPNGSHLMYDFFLKELLKEAVRGVAQNSSINIDISDLILDDFGDVTVTLEKMTDKGRRIDIFIESIQKEFVCVIENKVWSDEGCNQLEDYEAYINSHERYSKYKHKLFIFLTPKTDYDCTQLYKNYIRIDYGTICTAINKLLKQNGVLMSDNVRTFIEDYKNMVERNIMGKIDKEIVDLCRRIYRKNRNAIDMIISCTNISNVIMEHVAEIYDNDLISLNKNGMFSIKSFKNYGTLQCGNSEYGTDLVLLQLEKGTKGYSFCINVVPAKNGFEVQRKEIIAKLEQKLNRKLVDSEKENTWCYYNALVITESEFYSFDELEQIKDFLKKKIDETCFIPLLKELATNI